VSGVDAFDTGPFLPWFPAPGIAQIGPVATFSFARDIAMAPRRSSGSKAAEQKKKKIASAAKVESNGGNALSMFFAKFAHATARVAGKPGTFLTAVLVVVIWAACGPIFGFSDTWQLVINTSTTIITFLMVFVIQNSQNRDGLAIQIKLAELILSIQGPRNARAVAEDLAEEDLERLHKEYEKRAGSTLDVLEQRRETKK
jgi:low affinity Fe/Cu permease